MEKELPDQVLVRSALQDRHAFAALIERYEAPLRRYISRIGITDAETIKDILQESFIKAYVNLNDYAPSLSFSAWMYRIAHNETINHFRKQKNRPQPFENEHDLVLFDRIADEVDMEAQFDSRTRQTIMRDALGRLDQQYRDVLLLRYFEDKSYGDISDILQIPSGTVATYISRAKLKLKDILKGVHVTDV